MAFFAERSSSFSSITSLQLIIIKQCLLATVPKHRSTNKYQNKIAFFNQPAC